MSDDDPGTIPNADITGGSAVVADGTITQRENVDNNQGGEGSYDPYTAPGTWAEIWNSDFMRRIIPDMVGLHGNIMLVPTVGAGYSFNIDLLTRGSDAGFHISHTVTVRAGEEAGFRLNTVGGHYLEM